jgi:hypothetical protein
MAVPELAAALPPSSGGRLAPALKLVKAPPDSQVGTPVRVFALLLVLAAIFGGLWMFVLAGAPPAPEPKVIVPWSQRTAAQKAAAVPALPAAKAAPAAKTAAPIAAAKPKPKPVAKAKPRKPAKPTVNKNLPKPVVAALEQSPVVVVSLYTPGSAVADMAKAEARAGALAAKAGFVEIDVHKQKQVGPLVVLFGVTHDPAVLVLRRPGDRVVQLDGFVDREAVAQAAASAAGAS